MTNVVKNRIMRILAAIAIVCVGMVFTFSLNTAKAQNIAEEGFAVRAEAGVNISDNLAEEGIAFYTDVDTTIYQGEFEVYTLITAEKYLVDGDITSLTKESSGDMDACRVLAITSDIHGVGDVVTYMATITYDQLEEANLSSAYATKLVARSYMVTAEGEVIYAKNNNKAVSMQEVAKIHLAEALESEDAVTEEAFEKFIKYAGIKDVKAYYENATEVQFIDQDLNGAVVYALEVDEQTGKKDVVANLGTIQNGKLSNLELAMVGAGEKTQLIISNGEKAFATNAIEATQIIDSKEEFIKMFKGAYDQEDLFELATENELVATSAGGFAIDVGNARWKQIYDGYYVLATNVEFDAGEKLNVCGTSYNNTQIKAYAAANPEWQLAHIDWTGCGTRNWNSTTRYFTGTFDGLGHYVDGITYASAYSYLFGNVSGTIKNLAITNITFAGTNNTAFAYNITGDIENIYISVKQVFTESSGFAGNRQGALSYNGQYFSMKNVVIEYPDVNATYQNATSFYGAGYIDYTGYSDATKQNKNTTTENVLAITPTLVAGSYSSSRVNVASNDAEVETINGKNVSHKNVYANDGVRRYDDYDALKAANVDLSAFDNGMWDISTGAPIWANTAKSSVVVMPTELVFEASNEITSQTISITSDLVDLDVKYSVADTSIVTVEDGIVTVVDPYVGGNTVINYSYEIAGKTITGSIPVTVIKVKPVIGSFAVSAKNDAIPADLIKAVEGNITAIYEETDLTTNLLVDGKFDFANDTANVISKDVVVVCDDGKEYGATLDIYTDIITTASEFAATSWRTGTGAYALGANIDLAGTTVATMGSSNTWTGTFDGRGYVVDNLSAPARGIFGQTIGKKSIVKNVAFTNVVLPGGSTYCVFAWSPYQVTFQDIYVQVTSITTQRNGAIAGQMGGVYMYNSVIEFPEYNPDGPAVPVGEAAKDVANWVGVKGYPNETGLDQGGGILESNYYPYYSGSYVTADHYMSTTQGEQMKMSNVIAVSKTPALMTRYGQGFFVYAENEYNNYVNADGTWKTDAQGTSYGDYFTLITKSGTTTATTVGGLVFSKGIVRYDDYTGVRNANLDLSAFKTSGMWDTSTGAPIWAGLAIPSVEIAVDGKVGAEEIRITEEKESATFDISSKLVNVTFTGNIADTTIATYSNGVITKVANGGSTVFNYTYTVAGKTFTGSLPVVIEKAYAKLGTIIVDNDTTALTDLSVDGNIVSIKDLIDGTEYYVDNDITLTNDTNDVVSVEVIITTDTGAEYKATIDVYTKIIMNAAEFKEIFWTPEYSMIQTHTITYNGQTYKETFDELVDTDMVVKNGTSVYMDLSEEFKQMLADGATRAADSTTINASVVTGAYILGADIVDLGSNNGTYTYKYSPRGVTASTAGKGSIAASDKVIWGSASYDNAGYQLAGINAYLYEQEFTGLVDGNGHSISGFNSLTQGGLFGTLNNAIIKNLAVTGVVTETYKSNGAVQYNSASSGVIAYQNIGKETRIENVYIEITNLPTNTTRFGAIYYNNHASGSQVSTIKDVVIVMPTREWDYTQTFGMGIIGSSTSAAATLNPVTENVVAITGTDLVSGYGHASSVATRRAWIAENDAAWYETDGKFNSTIIGARHIQTGLFRYNDLSSAVAAGKTKVGNWVITAEGVSWQDSVQATYTISKKA